jgi:2-dehydropantoate 2-reductase
VGVAAVADPGGGAAGAMATLLAASWTAGGLPGRVYPDAAAMKWSKLLGNLVGNATSAILDMDPGEIYADRRTYPVERRQLHEAVAVMRALGLRPVSLPGADVSLLLRGLALPVAIGRPVVSRAIAGARGGKSPSLRLHVRRDGAGVPTEAPWLNGAVAAAGERVGVATPVNACLAALVDEVAADAVRAAWFAGRPDRLADVIAAWPTRP